MSNDVKKTEDPEDAEEGGEVAPIGGSAGGNKTKKLLMIIVPILLLVGGGAGLYFSGMLDSLLGKEHAAAEGEGGDHATAEGEAGHGDQAEGEGKEGEGGHAGGPSATFMKVPDLIVNLSSNAATGGPARYLRLSIQLELKSEADMKKVEAVMPRVIDQFQTYLRELRIDDLKGSKGIYRLQMELLSRVNAAAAPVEVKDVLFQEILIQ